MPETNVESEASSMRRKLLILVENLRENSSKKGKVAFNQLLTTSFIDDSLGEKTAYLTMRPL